jgi:hypothetical protein
VSKLTQEAREKRFEALLKSPLSGEDKRSQETKYSDYLVANFHKQCIFITSRVHPGEPQSSFSLEGMVLWLLSDDE